MALCKKESRELFMTISKIILFSSALVFLFFSPLNAFAQKETSASELLKKADSETQQTSPIRRIKRSRNKSYYKSHRRSRFRSIDGSNNNLIETGMNETDTSLIRMANADYSDGISSMAGTNRPSPRKVSNTVHAQNELTITYKLASDMLWQWGQFLDHDVDLSEGVHPAEPMPIPIPAGDELFDPNHTGQMSMEFNRTIYDTNTGITSPREQLNEITGWIDASNVYGSDEERATALRTMDGTGRLKTSKGNLLPFNEDGFSNAGGESSTLFLAGDARANEQVGLATMHTLFVREHNRLAKKIRKSNRYLSGENIYQRARKLVAAEMQIITYNEFLPVLLGSKALKRYRGYKPQVDATIANEFSTAAYRLGHSLLSPQLLRLNKRGKEIKFGHLALRDAFFSPDRIINEGGIEPLLRGLVSQPCQDLDELIIDDVRNFLFGQPGQGGFDLASLNIQRGRDHGLSSYTATRKALGLPTVVDFSDITSDPEKQAKLSSVYATVDDIDLWTGGLSEDKVPNSLVGETFHTILKDQFERLRDGDRFWYQRQYYGRDIKYIKNITLAKIIRKNTKIGKEIQRNVFITKN